MQLLERPRYHGTANANNRHLRTRVTLCGKDGALTLLVPELESSTRRELEPVLPARGYEGDGFQRREIVADAA